MSPSGYRPILDGTRTGWGWVEGTWVHHPPSHVSNLKWLDISYHHHTSVSPLYLAINSRTEFKNTQFTSQN